MAAVTICSNFGAQKQSQPLFPLFPHLFPMKWWDRMPWSSFSECWALSQLFDSRLLLSSRGFLVSLHFLPCILTYSHVWRLAHGHLCCVIVLCLVFSAWKKNHFWVTYTFTLTVQLHCFCMCLQEYRKYTDKKCSWLWGPDSVFHFLFLWGCKLSIHYVVCVLFGEVNQKM